MTPIDFLGLSARFVMQVMVACLKDNEMLISKWDLETSHELGIKSCEHCIPYVDSDGEPSDYWLFRHPIGPENIQIISIRETPNHDECSHAITLCYTHGTGHTYNEGVPVEHYAEYGVNEEAGVISLWAN